MSRVKRMPLDHNINKIDLLKIDVEGFEDNVFEGSKFLIKNGCIRKIIFEVCPGPLRGLDRTPEDVLRKVHDMGFEIQCIASDGRLEKVELPQFKPPYFANYLATPRSASSQSSERSRGCTGERGVEESQGNA